MCQQTVCQQTRFLTTAQVLKLYISLNWYKYCTHLKDGSKGIFFILCFTINTPYNEKCSVMKKLHCLHIGEKKSGTTTCSNLYSLQTNLIQSLLMFWFYEYYLAHLRQQTFSMKSPSIKVLSILVDRNCAQVLPNTLMSDLHFKLARYITKSGHRYVTIIHITDLLFIQSYLKFLHRIFQSSCEQEHLDN